MSAMLLRLICNNKNKPFWQTTLQTHTVLTASSFNFFLTEICHYVFFPNVAAFCHIFVICAVAIEEDISPVYPVKSTL